MDDFFDLFFRDRESPRWEARQSRRIDEASFAADVAASNVQRLVAENARLSDEVGRLRLLIQTLLNWHLARGDFDAETFSVLVARTDLADGVEDGALRPEVKADVPTCQGCSRPVNPRRERCVFCDAPVNAAPAEPPARRMVRCTSCRREVPEDATYYAASGLVCGACFTD